MTTTCNDQRQGAMTALRDAIQYAQRLCTSDELNDETLRDLAEEADDSMCVLFNALEVEKKLTALGFSLWHTGGNCTAWGRGDPNTFPHDMITLAEDGIAPRSISDKIAFWHCTSTEDPDPEEMLLAEFIVREED